MSLEAIKEHGPTADPEKAVDSPLPDFGDEKAMAEELPDLPEMIENFAQHGDLRGSREPSQEPVKKEPLSQQAAAAATHQSYRRAQQQRKPQQQ